MNQIAAEDRPRPAESATAGAAQHEELRAKVDMLADWLAKLEQGLAHELTTLQMRVLRAERVARARARRPASRTARHSRVADSGAPSAATTAPGATSALQFDYFMFEQRYRGTREDIKRRQTAYFDLFSDCRQVVDLGCGRGEFVELLSERGIAVIGVDSNPDMVAYCRDRGLNVVLTDLFDYLDCLPNASIDGIFAGQLVEHLSPAGIGSLLGLCAEKLKAGGLLVAETINPQCPAALNWFYLDPTHVRPVPSQLLAFMLEQGPYVVQSVLFRSPVPDSEVATLLEIAAVTPEWPAEVNLYQDYALVANRR